MKLMKSIAWGSILVLVVVACTPAKPPSDASNADDSSGPSSSGKGDNSGETWGSSEKASEAAKPKPPSPVSTPAAGGGSSSAAEASDTPAASADSGPHVPATLGGASYDRKTLEVGLKRAARQVKANCGASTDDNGVAGGPWGKTTVTVKLGHNGHSKGGTVPAPFDGKPTGKCAVQAFANLIYAPFPGADTDVDWPVEISKP
jgi:hypothetical protein